MTDTEPALTTPSLRLDGKIAMITGAGRGRGRACALALAQAGAEVALVSRTRSALEALAGEIQQDGGKAFPVVCDVTDTQAVERAVAALPGLDILVNNAGVNFPEPFTEVSEDHFNRIMALNVRASKLAGEGMTKAMGAELATHNIRVNSIGPTFILTPATRPFFENKAFNDDTMGRIPLGRLGELEDIMGAVVFLASPAAALITGASLVIDGGWTAI